MLLENPVNDAPLNALALSVDDPNLGVALLDTVLEVRAHHAGDIFGPKGVEIQLVARR
mgnify:CR=1 FL=1